MRGACTDRPASCARCSGGRTRAWRAARRMRGASGEGRPLCGQAIAAMPNRLSSLILRIVDRHAPPHYGANTRWCCTFCRAEDLRCGE